MKEPKKPAPPVTSTRRVPQKLDPPFFLILESYTKVPGSPPYPNREQHVPEKPEPGAAVEKGPESSGGAPPGRPVAGSGKAHLFPAAVRETQQGPAQDARGIIGVESADGEAVGLEERAQLGAREGELVELPARRAHAPIAPGEDGAGQPAQAIPVGHRHENDSPACQYPRRLGEDDLGPFRIVLDDTQRDIGGKEPVGHAEAAEIHDGERSARSASFRHRLRAPVDAHGLVAALAKQQDVLPQPAACLEDRALAREVLLEQRGQRRGLRHAEELLHGMPAPVLGPELSGGGARVIGERHGWPSAPRHAAHELDLALYERAQVVALGHEGPAGLPEPGREGRVVQDSPQAIPELMGTVGVEEQSSLAVSDERSIPGAVGGDAWQSTRHGLKESLRMPFRERREDEDVRGTIDCGQFGLFHYPGEVDLDPQFPGPRLEIASERTRTYHDVESAIADVGRRGHDSLQVLLHRQTTDVEYSRRARTRRRSGGRKQLGVHALREQLDARGAPRSHGAELLGRRENCGRAV